MPLNLSQYRAERKVNKALAQFRVRSINNKGKVLKILLGKVCYDDPLGSIDVLYKGKWHCTRKEIKFRGRVIGTVQVLPL